MTVGDQFPMPFMSSIIQSLKGARFLSSLNMTMDYFQCTVAREDRAKTAFTCSAGLFQFRVLPFGLKSAPSTFNRLMAAVLRPVYGVCALAYLDDVIIFSQTFQQHLLDLEQVFHLLGKENLCIKLRKCQFCRLDFRFLGHILRDGKIFIDDSKLLSIRSFRRPQNLKEVQRFLGLTGWLRSHVREYAHIARPLAALTGGKNPKKDFKWTNECELAFKTLKTKLIEPGTALALPNFSLPFTIECDVADNGIAGVLSQQHEDGTFHVVEYASRTLQPREVHYTITEKELLAVIFSIFKFRQYIADRPFTVITDHSALRWLLKTKDLSGRLTRWSLKLQEYDYTVRYKKGAENVIPDALSRGTTVAEEFDPDGDDHRMTPPTTPAIVNIVEIKLIFTDVSPELIRIEQMKEKWILDMIERIKEISVKNPDIISFKKYHLLNDTLFYKPWDESLNFRVVLPRSLINKVLTQFHTDPSGGHFGIQKTLQKIQARVFWHHMLDDITTFVKTCHTCQMTKHPNVFLRGPMQSNYVSHPMELWGVDLMGPYTRSTRQNKFLLVIVDHYSKWLEVFPMRGSQTNTIVMHLTECMGRYGVPERLLSDNGPQFISTLYRTLCRVWKVKEVHSTSYHPSSNFVENTNKTIKRLLRSYMDDNQSTWDMHIPQFLLAIRTTVNSTTGFTPARLFLGRELPLPWDTSNGSGKTQIPGTVEDYVRNVTQANEAIRESVSSTMNQHKQLQKEYYDKRTRARSFKEGDLVKIKNFVLSDASKKFTASLAPVWKGPFVICRKISDLVYVVSDKEGREIGTWNIANLDTYYESVNKMDINNDNNLAGEVLAEPFTHNYCTRSKENTM